MTRELLPLSMALHPIIRFIHFPHPLHRMVEGVGFEPTKASPADLQSAPVDRLGTPPELSKPAIFLHFAKRVNTKFDNNHIIFPRHSDDGALPPRAGPGRPHELAIWLPARHPVSIKVNPHYLLKKAGVAASSTHYHAHRCCSVIPPFPSFH